MTVQWTVRRLKYICCKLNYNIYSRVGNTWCTCIQTSFFIWNWKKLLCSKICKESATWHVHTHLLLVITLVKLVISLVNYFSIFRVICKLKKKVHILLSSKNFSQIIDASFCCLSRKSLIQIKLCLHLQRYLIKFYNIFIQLQLHIYKYSAA